MSEKERSTASSPTDKYRSQIDMFTVPPLKPGYQTTEFWMSLAAVILGAIQTSGLLGEGTATKVIGAVVAGLAALGYSASRGLVKLGRY